MTSTAITSRENPLMKELRKFKTDGGAYRKSGRLWIEGEHLCQAFSAKGLIPEFLLVSESNWPIAHVNHAWSAIKTIVVADALMKEISTLETPAAMGMVCAVDTNASLQSNLPCVVLDRLQDPGNVGSILRSAAAFGYSQVLALKGTVALWSPKVLRAGMGAHFGLRLIESAPLDQVRELQHPLAVTSSHQGTYLHDLVQKNQIPSHLNWAMGHEGQGVSEALAQLAQLHVRIAQPGGQESLNVAAAAAICLHASGTVGRS